MLRVLPINTQEARSYGRSSTAHLAPKGIVVSGHMLMVTDGKARNVHLYRRHDGKLLATTDTLESWPFGICFINDTEICVILYNGTIETMSVQYTEDTGVIKRKLHVNTAFDSCYGVVRFMDKVVICGEKQHMICWCIVSLNDGHVDTIHKICEGDIMSKSYLTTKNNKIYISCHADYGSPDTGVYGYDIQNPGEHTFIYKHKDLKMPTGITVDIQGFLFVCNWYPYFCIYHLTDECELVTIYCNGIPSLPYAIFWDHGIMYVTSYRSNVITRYKLQYSHQQDPVIPVEILHMDNNSIELYKEALRDGKEKVYSIRVMVVGQYGVGKTTLTKRLLGQQVDISERKSTEAIDVYEHCCKISLDTGEWIVQPKDSDRLARLQRLVKILANQAERSEVSGEQEGHREDINQYHFSDSDDDDTPTSTNIIYHDFSNTDDNISTSSESDIDQEVDITSKQPEESSLVQADHRPEGTEAYSVSIMESGEHVTSRGDAMMEFLQLVNKEADKVQKNLVEYAALSMWDFAGQYVFYTTHQMFLTRRAIYLLVTNLSQQFTDLVKDDECYFDTEGVKFCEVQDLVEVWLNSIHCCAKSRADGTLVTSTAAGIAVTSSAAGSTVTSSAAGTTMTSSAAGTMVISPSAVTTVTSFATGTMVTSPSAGTTVTSSTADTIVTSSAAGITVTSSTAGTTVTSSAVGTTVTSSAAGITMTSSAADTTAIYPAGYTELASPGTSTSVTSPDISIPLTPPVILVGTHVDKIQEDKRQKVISTYFPQICHILKDKPALRHVVTFFAIDNTQLNLQLQTLKDRILKLAKEQPYWGEELPTSWLPMEEALMKLKASGKKIIPLSLVEELNRATSVPIETAEQLDLFLRFQHEIGTILYFSVDELKEKIVLDPQWFIDALKSLITAEVFILDRCPAIRNKWFELKDTGKLTPELIDAIWSRENNPEFYDNKEHMLLVMEQLNIIAKPRSYIEDGEEFKEENYFLAPCMLQQKTPEEVICPKPNDQMESSSVLSYVFIDKFLPSPIFHRLLAACVAHWPIAIQKKEGMQENMIFCGCCVFQLDQYHKLTLHFREYVILLRVTRMGIKDKTPSSKLCIEAREFITKMLLKIIGYLGQSLKFEHFIQCPEYNGVSINSLIPVSLLKENAEVHCDFHDNIIESCKLLKFWFEDQQQQEMENRQLSGSDEDQGEEGQDNADTPITQEHINHARLCNALTTVCANALREILINQVPVPYADIYQAILANEANLTRKLNNDQSNVVFPDTPGITGTVDQFDTSLLYTIIRNVSSIPAPTTGWGDPPVDQPRDTSLGASVERIRFSRNKLSGHSVDGKISETEFKDYWQQIDDVLHDIESVIGVRGYRVQLEKRKSQAITPHEARQLQRQFQEYKKQVEDAKEKLRIAMEAVERLLI